ncbi:CKLF-like MARVEL transmembrane domain-containing protein 4 [Asterias amurensis]|uniref:CKLF-like MARVEL transmembrane domain-containing protein 4 n=1 Tax=Asterias amurensis TaxID=7602 RepID=UPI003AB4091B
MTDKTVEVATVSSHHTVSTTSTTTTTPYGGTTTSSASCTCDLNYLRSVQGITKILEILLSFMAFIIMVAAPNRNGSLNFFLFVAIAACAVSSIILLLLCTHLHLKVALPWNIVFAGVYAVLVVVFFVAFIFAAVNAANSFHGSATTLGFFAIVAYIGSLVSAVQDWRLSRQMMQQTPGGSTAATGPFSGQQEPPAYESQY